MTDLLVTGEDTGDGGVNLQDAYDEGPDGVIVITTALGPMTIRDNSTPTGGNLLQIQNNGGGTTFFSVSATQADLGVTLDLNTNNIIAATDILGAADIRILPSGDADDGLLIRTVSNDSFLLPVQSTRSFFIGNTEAAPCVDISSVNTTCMAIIPTDRNITDTLTGWLVIPSTTTVTMDRLNGSIGAIFAADNTFQFRQQGLAVGAGNLFRNSATFTNESGFAVSFGSQYTFVNVAKYQSDGEAISSLLVRTILHQPVFQTINAGTLAITTV